MARPFDASFEEDDEYLEHREDTEWDTDAFRACMDQGGVSQFDDGRILEDRDDEDLAPAPAGLEADEPGDAADHGQNWNYITQIQQRIDGVNDLGEFDDEAVNNDEARAEDGSASTDGVIAESLRETVEAVEEWFFERAVEVAADTVIPGLGRVINIAFKIKEAFGDIEALTSPDSPHNLHVPLFHVAGGLAVDLNVHLQGSDRAADTAPPVTGFLSPGDDGLFGGWELEVDRPSESKKHEASASDQDARPVSAEHVARPSVAHAERSHRQEPSVSTVIKDDLSLVKRWMNEPWRRAVALREAASRLQTRLYARPEFAAEQVLVICDPLAGLGMWLVNPGLAHSLARRRIVIRLVTDTGIMLVLIE